MYKRLLLSYRDYSAINVYVALCYARLDYYDVSQVRVAASGRWGWARRLRRRHTRNKGRNKGCQAGGPVQAAGKGWRQRAAVSGPGCA